MVKNLNTTDEGTQVRAGHKAGYIGQGSNSNAIGVFAGYKDQPDNTNVINASGDVLNGDQVATPLYSSGGTFIAPIKPAENKVLTYNPDTKEVTVSDKNSGDLSDNAKVSLQTVTDGNNPIVVGTAPFNSTDRTTHFTAGKPALGANNNDDAITVGGRIGFNNGITSVVIGNGGAPITSSPGEINRIAIGVNCGLLNQKSNAIAIGTDAGVYLQGTNSIAIGEKAGTDSGPNAPQSDNSIVLNATGNVLQAPTSGLFIKPIALGNEEKVLTWNTVSGEIKASDEVVPNHYAVVVSGSLLSTIHSSPGTYLRLPHNLNTPTDYDKYRVCFRAFSMSHPNGTTQVTSNVTVGTSVLNQVGNVISAGPNTAFNSYNVFSNSPYTNKIEFKDATHLFEQNYFDTNYMCVRYIDKYNENITIVGDGISSGHGPVKHIDFNTNPPTTYYHPPIASSSWLTKSGGNTEFYLFVIYKI